MIIIKYFRTLLEKQDGSDDELLAAGDEDINVSLISIKWLWLGTLCWVLWQDTLPLLSQ